MDYPVKDEANQTAFSFLKQFNLKGNINLDIHLFLNQTATICSIQLNLRQWNTLQRVSNDVNTAIKEAKYLYTSDKDKCHIHDGAYMSL